MTTLRKTSAGIVAFCAAIFIPLCGSANPALPLLNEPVDVSPDFRDFSDLYYLADKLGDFDPATASGKITYQRAEYFTRQAFDNMLAVIKPVGLNEFPEDQYAVNPALPFSIEFVSPRTLRIRATSGPHRPSGREWQTADGNRPLVGQRHVVHADHAICFCPPRGGLFAQL